MIVAELQPSGFTFAANKADQALDWAREHAKKWPSTAVRLYDWFDFPPDRVKRNGDPIMALPNTLTVPL